MLAPRQGLLFCLRACGDSAFPDEHHRDHVDSRATGLFALRISEMAAKVGR